MTNSTSVRRRRGMSLIFVAAMFCVLVGMASFAVDYGKVNLARTELRRSVDAACLAGCSGLSVSPAEARARARAYALSNPVNGAPLTLLDSDIEMGSWNAETRVFTVLSGANETTATAVRVTGRLARARNSQVSLIFLPLIGGQSACEATASAVAGTGATTADIVIAQDNSTSFVDELPNARAGLRALLDDLYYFRGGKSGFGLVKFAGSASTVAALQQVTGNYTTLTNAIDSLRVVNPANGTDIAAGIERAQVLFDGYSSGKNTRALIICSDGTPTSSVVWAHRWLNANQLLEHAQDNADLLWDQEIHIYVVFMDVSNDQNAASRLRTLIRGNGVFIQVTDPAKLPAALASITRMLPSGLVK